MTLDTLTVWAREVGRGESVEFVCGEHAEELRGSSRWRTIRTPGCVADLGLEYPMEMLALGVNRIAVRRDGCGAPERLDERLRLWAVLFEMVGAQLTDPPGGRRRRDAMRADNMPTIARRSLFGLGKPDPREDDTWEPDLLATGQQRLRAAMLELGAVATEAAAEAGTGWQLSAEGCVAGGQCVAACPHDALRLHTSDGADGGQRSRLVFDPSLCSGCGRCVDFCDAGAMRRTGLAGFDSLLSTEPLQLASVETRRCVRCRAVFVPDDEEATLCRVCAERRANPFGSTLPPEAIERLRRLRDR